MILPPSTAPLSDCTPLWWIPSRGVTGAHTLIDKLVTTMASAPAIQCSCRSYTSKDIWRQGIGSFCRETLCFNTMPCRHMPWLVHFWNCSNQTRRIRWRFNSNLKVKPLRASQNLSETSLAPITVQGIFHSGEALGGSRVARVGSCNILVSTRTYSCAFW